MDDSNPELESFRQQWRAEVTARSKVDDSKGHRKNSFSQASKRKQPGPSRLAAGTATVEHDEEEDDAGSTAPVKGLDSGTNGPSTNTEDIVGFGNGATIREPRSALEHYERAVERESQGSLGDSLNLYRKAFKVSAQSNHSLCADDGP
jgi:F-box protein 9